MSKWTRKHYRESALRLHATKPIPKNYPEDCRKAVTLQRLDEWQQSIASMCEMYAADNPRFRYDIFEEWCVNGRP